MVSGVLDVSMYGCLKIRNERGSKIGWLGAIKSIFFFKQDFSRALLLRLRTFETTLSI